MRWLPITLLLIACSGCSVTLTGNANWSEVDSSVQDLDALRQKHEQLSVTVQKMTQELAATPPEMDAVLAVLTKYGIKLQGK